MYVRSHSADMKSRAKGHSRLHFKNQVEFNPLEKLGDFSVVWASHVVDHSTSTQSVTCLGIYLLVLSFTYVTKKWWHLSDILTGGRGAEKINRLIFINCNSCDKMSAGAQNKHYTNDRLLVIKKHRAERQLALACLVAWTLVSDDITEK